MKEEGMEDSNAANTPCITTPLGKYEDGYPFVENCEYAVLVGMLIYLAANSRPDSAYSVNQCARFMHCPEYSHAIAVKRILRYLKGTATKGTIINSTDQYTLNCYADADFAGL